MCELTRRHYLKLEAKGWKVVAAAGGKNYSIATGICYDNHSTMPEVTNPKPLIEGANGTGLRPRGFDYVDNMVGRTAIFMQESDALQHASVLRTFTKCPGYSIEIKLAVVSRGIMSGTYSAPWLYKCPVLAGKKIKFIKHKYQEELNHV